LLVKNKEMEEVIIGKDEILTGQINLLQDKDNEIMRLENRM